MRERSMCGSRFENEPHCPARCVRAERKQRAGTAKCDGCQGEFSELRDFPTSGRSAVAPSGGGPRLGLNLGGLPTAPPTPATPPTAKAPATPAT